MMAHHKIEENNSRLDDSNGKVIIEVDGHHISFEKELLIQNSDYFKAMFSSSMKEAESNFVKLSDISYEQIRLLLKCLEYGGFKSNITEDNIFNVTEAACMFQFSGISEMCSSFLIGCLTVKNCLKIMSFSGMFSLLSVYNKARRYALWFFSELCETGDFLALSSQDLKIYLSDDFLNSSDEFEVFQAVASWCAHDSCRRGLFEEVFRHCIRYCFFKEDDIEHLLSNQLVKSSTEVFQTWLRDEIQNRGKIQSSKNTHRAIPWALLRVGGFMYDKEVVDECKAHKIPNKDVEVIDHITGNVIKLTDLEPVFSQSSADMGYAVCVSGKDMFISGGETALGKNTWQMNVWKFDILKEHWDIIGLLKTPRRHHGNGVLNKELYLIGGFGRYRKLLSSVEKLDLETGNWTTIKPMPQSIINPAVTTHKESLYVAKTEILMYNPYFDQWTQLTNNFTGLNSCVNFGVSTSEAIYFTSSDHLSIIKLDTITNYAEIIDQCFVEVSDSNGSDHEMTQKYHGGVTILHGCVFRYCRYPSDNLQRISVTENKQNVALIKIQKSQNRCHLFTAPVYPNVFPP